MSKILIAGLGKGKKEGENYQLTNYSIEKNGKNKNYEESLITAVLEKHFKIDKTIYIGTVGSMWDNLYIYYCNKLGRREDPDYSFELYESISNATKDTKFSEINIERFNEEFKENARIILTKYGMNSNEIFENFNLIIEIGELLNDGDEIYLDITYSFRSNAMRMFLVINYITDVLDKKVKIKMISYGMFEAGYKDKEKKDKEGNPLSVTPIVDLKAFFDLMKWIKGAHSFKYYGNSYEFLDMLKNKEIKRNMKLFSDSMNLNYISSIKRNIEEIKKLKKSIENLKGPSQLLLPKILGEFTNIIEGEDYEILLNLSEWHYRQKRYTMMYVNAIEAIYLFGAKVLKEKYDEKTKKNIRKWITHIDKDNNTKDEEIEKRKELKKIFNNFRNIRNNISHALEDERDMSIEINNIGENLIKLKEIFKINFIYNK